MARTRDPEKKIALIRQAAAEIIIEDGPDALTHRAVAARAGVAVGTTTKYFATMDDLRKSALEYLSEEVHDDLVYLKQSLEDCGDPVEMMANELVRVLSDQRTVVRECSLVFAGVFDADIRDISLVWAEGVADILAQHFSRPQLEAMAAYVDGVIMRAALQEPCPSKAQIETVLRALASMDEG